MATTADPRSAAARLHEEATIVDGTVYFLPEALAEQIVDLDLWAAGGATACAVTVAFNHTPGETASLFGQWYRQIEARRMLLATSVEDIRRAKQERRLAIIFHFQNIRPFEHDVGLLAVYHRLGLRVVQLTYNRRNALGDGCEEGANAGLSEFGHSVVAEMNRLGIVVDLSHTGERTTLEAMDASSAPCIFSHSNVKALCVNARNLTDEQVKAVAARNGVIGMNGTPAFISKSSPPTIDEYIDHMVYIADLVGARHVALGTDYGDSPTVAEYEHLLSSGAWKPENYPPPPWHYATGFEDASKLPNLVSRMLERGFSEADVRGILGENLLRVFAEVWQN